MIFGDMFLGVDTTFSPLGTPCAIINVEVQAQVLIAGVEAEEVPHEEDDPDADFAGAPLLAGGDEDEWETWCTEHLQPLP